MTIIRCISCDGYGWFDDPINEASEACDWCGGIGYVYRMDDGTDRQIPAVDLRKPAISEQLEALETERMREIGYTGRAKRPWEQDIRDGTQGGANPYDDDC